MWIMTVFDLLVLGIGVYMAAAALHMKRTGSVGTMLVTEEEMRLCRDKDGFIAAVYGKEALFGGLMALLGAVGLLCSVLTVPGWFKYVRMAVLLAAFLWFQNGMNRARKTFFK